VQHRSDPDPAAVADLLGMLAYGELLAFDRMAADARLAPDLRRRAVLSEMAGAEMANYRLLARRLTELGVEPADAMAPYLEPLRDYHDRTQPHDWLEALTKAYVGEGIADDFFREVAAFLRERDRALVLRVLHESRYQQYAAAEIGEAVREDERVRSRLSMWARRLVGEALCQAHRVAAARPLLAGLIVAGSGDQAGVQALFKRLIHAHSERMATVGLNS